MSANRGARWLLYGANGYTGALIAEEAVRRGLRPILAGRRAEAVRPLAARLGLEVRVFSLDSVEEIARGLEGVGAVCLAAGPFARTSAPMVQACLATRTHYTDITGEVPIFEACHRLDVEAKAAGIALLPGVGFDVVPTDCLAASLAARLPTARRLALAFAVEGGPSGGTARTMIEGLPEGGLVRRGGRLVRVPAAHATRWVPFHDRSRHAVAFPWGDVSTAFYSTGIGDIEVYMAAPRIAARALGATRHLTGLLGSRPAQRALRGLVQLAIRDPDAQANRAAS
ncbi:MAG: NAD(P)H-binding protein, partial [Myxococcales bacterium]|nr:NAD(P)H-binding protein [Myxococcales bacterium]